MENKKLLTEINNNRKLMGLEILNETLDVQDISDLSDYKSGQLKQDKYFILHHTAGRSSAQNTVGVLNNRVIKGKKVVLGVQWIIDREGKIYSSLPKGSKGAHILNANMPGVPKDISNSTSQGVEIVAKDNSDVLPIQCLAALKLVKDLKYSLNQIYGHGEINKHKARNEGEFCKTFITKHWSDDLDELEEKMKSKDFIEDVDITPSEEDKVEKILKSIGLKKLADMDIDKDGKKFSKEVSNLLGLDKKKDNDSKDEDEKDEDPGFLKSTIGMSFKELVAKAKELFKTKIIEDIEKMKKPLK